MADETQLARSSRLNQRAYLVVLVGVAVAVLVIGFSLRPSGTPPKPVPESERTRLQTLALRQDIYQRTRFAAQRARLLLPRLAELRAGPASDAFRIPEPGARLLLVAPGPQGEPVWIETSYVAEASVKCRGTELREMVTASALPHAFEAAVAFDLDDFPVALTHDCGGRLALLPPSGFARILEPNPRRDLRSSLGIDAEVRPGGALVKAVDAGSGLERAGLEPGDLIVRVNGAAVAALDDLRPLFDRDAAKVLEVRREPRTLTLRIPASPSSLGVRWRSAQPLEVSDVVSGGAAERWGLQPGDIVTRAGTSRPPTRAAVEKVLGGAAGPLAVRRGRTQLLLEPPK